MSEVAIQDLYPAGYAHCHGCGRLNAKGLRIRSFWDGDGAEAVARFTPAPEHISVPGFVYGGLLASLVDCHAIGTAAAYRAGGARASSGGSLDRYVTASLRVEYLRPTPLGPELEVRARVKEVKGRKSVVEAWIVAEGQVCVRGEVVAVQLPESMAGSSTPAAT
jgi:acyl-coenzyme A thioesterase PaaI-like protein